MTESNQPTKPARRKTRYPLESFPPQFKETWLRACRETIRIDFRDSYETDREAVAKATRFCMLMNTFRRRYQESDASDWRLLYGAQISRRNKSAQVVISPAKGEFAAILSETLAKTDVSDISPQGDVEPPTPLRGDEEAPSATEGRRVSVPASEARRARSILDELDAKLKGEA